MTSPEPTAGCRRSKPFPGEEVVISGLSGNFPESDGIYEFRENLFRKIDLVTEDDRRWSTIHPDIPQRAGKLKSIHNFDADFFNISHDESNGMDPMARILLEKTYEAIVDAGLHPNDLNGTRTGVYIAACFSESEVSWMFDADKVDGYGIIGCSRSMLANRISYWLNLLGPSFNIDTACSSSYYAVEKAFADLHDGICDYAIVGGTNLCLSASVTLQFSRLGVLGKDGKCYVFDSRAQGYVRSETVGVMLFQKAKTSKRIYAQVIHVKTNCDGYKPQGITYPSTTIQQHLLTEFYEECSIKPETISYVEAHGTATFVGDLEEGKTIDAIFCKSRKTPLKVGSVKSNIGHTEPAAGICSMAKLIIAFETGLIPPNLHFESARPEIAGLHEGRMQIVTETTPLEGCLAATNSFGFGGANAHALFAQHQKIKQNNGSPVDNLPRLVAVSGRTTEAVAAILDDLDSRPLDAEFVRLLHDIHRKDIKGHEYRGYALLQKGEPRTIVKSIAPIKLEKRPVWFLFNGVGSQWPGMGSSLMPLPPFAEAIKKCDKVLSSMGVNVTDIITDTYPKIFDNKLNCIVGITAMQIGLVDVLSALGIHSDRIFGQSVDHFGWAYAEGSLTLEQTILSAYSTGLNAIKHNSIKGKVPDEIRHIISESKTDSHRWAESVLHSMNSRKSYKNNHCNGGVNEFPKQDDIVPITDSKNIIVEIGPNYYLKNIPADGATHVILTRSNFNNINVLLKAVGSLYNSGLNPNLAKLYPDIEFPVSRSTPMVSPLIRWNHTKDWSIPFVEKKNKNQSGIHDVYINIKLEKFRNIAGHVIDGRNLFPATGYLVLVWELLAEMNNCICESLPIEFENIEFIRATNIPKDGEIQLLVMVQRGTGKFEVSEGGVTVVSGTVRILDNPSEVEAQNLPQVQPIAQNDLQLSSKDFYKLLRLRGYNYEGLFRSIQSMDIGGSVAEIKWFNDWTAFMDNMLQIQIVQDDSRGLYVPTSIEKLIINPVKQFNSVHNVTGENVVTVHYYRDLRIIKGGGIEIRNLNANAINRRKILGEPVLEKQEFIPFHHCQQISLVDSIRVCVQLALDAHPTIKVKVFEIDNGIYEPLATTMQSVLGDLPLIQAEVIIMSEFPLELPNTIKLISKQASFETDVNFLITSDVLSNPAKMIKLQTSLKKDGYIITQENSSVIVNNLDEFTVLCSTNLGNSKLFLLRPTISPIFPENVVKINSSFSWLPSVQNAMKKNQPLVLYAQNEPLNGLIGLVNCIRKEPGGHLVQCVNILDNNAPPFDNLNEFYRIQLNKKLPINVYKNGQWGSLRHLILEYHTTITDNAYLDLKTPGDLSTFTWFEGNINEDLENQVTIKYCALNFRDIMLATGKLNSDVIFKREEMCSKCQAIMGFEYSGWDNEGRRVMGMMDMGCLASKLKIDPYIMMPVPDHWTLEEAATVPVVYGTVIAALLDHGMRAGHKVLIHAGSGGVGQAAITLALYYGCTVFTTVGTEEKKKFILKQFPTIKENYIGSSRNTTFEQMVMKETNGEGVDYVLNSLSEEKLQASLRCVAAGGKFVEIGKFDLSKNSRLGMRYFTEGRSFHSVMLDRLFQMSPATKTKLKEKIIKGIQEGAIKPLNRTIFDQDQIEEAFRYMAAGKHIGKVLVDLKPDSKEELQTTLRAKISAAPRTYCDIKKTYVIIGGLGGFGLELMSWLISCGAKKILLSSRRGISNGYQLFEIRKWQKKGIDIRVSQENVSTVTGCKKLLQTAVGMGPVDAIFNLAVVLRDALIENQTEESFQESFAGKALATQFLDILSRELCPNLTYFVVFSSVSCGRGNAGQSNYGMANSVMERICEQRTADGLPGLAIQWGAVGDVGLVADMQENDTLLEIGGTLQQKISSCLDVMNIFLKEKSAVVASMVVAEKRSGFGSGDNLVNSIFSILGLRDMKTISMHSTLAELGMDSMMAVEIKQTLEREFEIFLSAQEIRDLTFTKIIEFENDQDNSVKLETNHSAGNLEMLLRNFGDEKSLNGQTGISIPSIGSINQDSPIIFVPGIEGQANIFKVFCKDVTSRTLALQYGFENQCSSIEEIADVLYPVIEAELKPDQEYKLVAYSFGVLVTLEIILRLEASGRKGKAVFIDGGPSFGKTLFNENENIEITVLSMICRSLNMTNYDGLLMNLTECKTWDERLEIFLNNMPSSVPYSRAYQLLICSTLLRRVKALLAYEPNNLRKIQGQVLLIRPMTQVFTEKGDYNLHEIAQNVSVTELEGNHYTVFDNPKLVEIVNDIFT